MNETYHLITPWKYLYPCTNGPWHFNWSCDRICKVKVILEYINRLLPYSMDIVTSRRYFTKTWLTMYFFAQISLHHILGDGKHILSNRQSSGYQIWLWAKSHNKNIVLFLYGYIQGAHLVAKLECSRAAWNILLVWLHCKYFQNKCYCIYFQMTIVMLFVMNCFNEIIPLPTGIMYVGI